MRDKNSGTLKTFINTLKNIDKKTVKPKKYSDIILHLIFYFQSKTDQKFFGVPLSYTQNLTKFDGILGISII